MFILSIKCHITEKKTPQIQDTDESKLPYKHIIVQPTARRDFWGTILCSLPPAPLHAGVLA